jgi:hypothetical protein
MQPPRLFSVAKDLRKSQQGAIRDKSATTQIVFSAQKTEESSARGESDSGESLQPPKSISEAKKLRKILRTAAPTHACELATTNIDFGKKKFEENIGG